MGNQSWFWANSAPLGNSAVGWSDYDITGLSSDSTYYARVKASNENGDAWFGPVNWTTRVIENQLLTLLSNSSRLTSDSSAGVNLLTESRLVYVQMSPQSPQQLRDELIHHVFCSDSKNCKVKDIDCQSQSPRGF